MSVAYTLGVSPAGYVAEQSYVALAVIASAGYLLVAALYALAFRAPRPVERNEAGVLRETVAAFRDRSFLLFAALAFVFPLSMGLVVVASPLWGADVGLGEGYIGLVLGGNSLIVAALAVPLAARIEPLGPFRLRRGSRSRVRYRVLCRGAGSGGGLSRGHRGVQLRRARFQLRSARGGGAARAGGAARRLPGRLDTHRFLQHG